MELFSALMTLTTMSCLQAVAAISEIRKDVPVHLELASMTDMDYMNSIMQEVHATHSAVVCPTFEITSVV